MGRILSVVKDLIIFMSGATIGVMCILFVSKQVGKAILEMIRQEEDEDDPADFWKNED